VIDEFRNEQRRHRQQLEGQRRDIKDALEGDVVIDGNRRLMLRSPNGHYWALSVGNTGTLAATDVGTSL
jgi:hypothetical protein